ncbi:MAG: type pilus assembly ATPase PilB, type pilus assembly protein PilB [Candidatus Parcubacteria bacterium]|jgi:type IV pilus assembly protein PilB
MVQFDEDKQSQRIDELKQRESEQLAQIMASRLGLEYIDLSGIAINTDALRIIPEATAREGRLAVFDSAGKNIKIALLSATNEKAIQAIEALKAEKYIPTLFITSPTSLEKAFREYKSLSYAFETRAGALDISSDDILDFLKKLTSTIEVKKQIDEMLANKKGNRISKILEIMLAGALATNSSDIHIEPEENAVRLRFRLDGVLTDITIIDTETYGLILSRIKLISGLKLNTKKDAQDGRFSVNVNGGEIEIRTSIIPNAYSESIVLRVLNPKSIAVPLESMGISPRLLSILLHEVEKPNGMILTTGPTGSGKTTTLYAFLRKVNNPGIKIITIEDPIEYHLANIVQTQTNDEKGYTFLSGLRAALRQDPDIIMVGEIRDEETAEIAINSALTGHLVFSTLHTNNAAGTFPRLIDLGVNPKVITSAVNIALAQRLLRTLCVKCKKTIEITGDEKILIDNIIATLPDPSVISQKETMCVAVGCNACNGTGYKGRTGVYEAILKDRAIEEAVQKNPSERDIRLAAKPQGIPDMRGDGVIKILAGITSLDELGRVIDLTEEL